MSSRTAPPPTAGAHRDAAYRFAVAALYFAVVSGVGSLLALLFGPFGIVVSVLVSLVGVYFGGVEVARGIDIVVRHAIAESGSGSSESANGAEDGHGTEDVHSAEGERAKSEAKTDGADSDESR
jgi:hypothetical protein